MPNLEFLLQEYGYLATATGCMVEGETILLVAAFLAHKGYLQIERVMLAGALGSFLGDSLSYLLGKWKAGPITNRFAIVQRHLPRAQTFLKRYGALSILLMRFSYGLRVVSGFICGVAGMPPARFLPYAAIACTVWAVVITGAGYLFGHLADVYLYRISHYEKIFAGLLLVGALLLWLARISSRAKREPAT